MLVRIAAASIDEAQYNLPNPVVFGRDIPIREGFAAAPDVVGIYLGQHGRPTNRVRTGIQGSIQESGGGLDRDHNLDAWLNRVPIFGERLGQERLALLGREALPDSNRAICAGEAGAVCDWISRSDHVPLGYKVHPLPHGAERQANSYRASTSGADLVTNLHSLLLSEKLWW